jgi:DNA-binding PadR family transcriptional regulator
MSSPVNWALLGLVIERASYGYELAQRYARTYDEVLPVSSASHIYAALNALEARSLIERLPVGPTQSVGRQPKPHYRATELGYRAYSERLVAQLREDRRRSRLLVRELAVFARDPETALRVIADYERICLQEAANPLPGGTGVPADADGELLGRLMCEESRVGTGAMLSWVEYARREFEELVAAEELQR